LLSDVKRGNVMETGLAAVRAVQLEQRRSIEKVAEAV
jgi:hypothetical protein